MHDRDWLAHLEFFGIKLGLDAITAILDELGRPHRAYPVIHIAGTNGKGSVAAMVSHALTAGGRRTGRYTSPHLVAIEERFAVDGHSVGPDALDEALRRVRAAVERLTERGTLDIEPTYFEVTTAAAFEIFRKLRVDVAVIEVGLGGRLDATNVVTPAITAITSVDIDHEAQLGASIAAIAGEKAGIIKAGVPVIAGEMTKEAFRVIAEIAAATGAPLVSSDCADIEVRGAAPGQYELTLRIDRGANRLRHGYGGPPKLHAKAEAPPPRVVELGPVVLGLRGRHQIGNAVVAALILERLPQSLAVGPTAIEAGLRDARWPGRLDLVALGHRTILVDGAHNPAGARALASYLSEAHPAGLPLVFGVMADKQARAMLAELVPLARPLILTRAPGRRAADPHALASLIDDAPGSIVVEPEIARALANAWSTSDAIAVAGSLYLAGEVYRLLDVWIA
jgi:dihydrofolate synthase/folylpolyglutamate synthase